MILLLLSPPKVMAVFGFRVPRSIELHARPEYGVVFPSQADTRDSVLTI